MCHLHLSTCLGASPKTLSLRETRSLRRPPHPCLLHPGHTSVSLAAPCVSGSVPWRPAVWSAGTAGMYRPAWCLAIKVLLSSERNGETSTSKAGVQGPHKQLKITGGTLFVIFLSRHSEHRSDMVRQHFVSGCSERKTDSRFSRQAPTFKHPKLFFVSQKNIDSYFRGKGVHGFTAPPLQANDMMSNLCHQTTRFPSEHTFFGQAGRCLLKGFLVFKN